MFLLILDGRSCSAQGIPNLLQHLPHDRLGRCDIDASMRVVAEPGKAIVFVLGPIYIRMALPTLRRLCVTPSFGGKAG